MPNRTITQAPRWLSTDLRDGNQALIDPMDAEKEDADVRPAVKVGLKEIEVGFPSAGATEFDFISGLIRDDRIPDDVTIQVLTQSAPRPVSSAASKAWRAHAPRSSISTTRSPSLAQDRFRHDPDEVRQIAIEARRSCATRPPSAPTRLVLRVQPETFSTAELDFSVEVCAPSWTC